MGNSLDTSRFVTSFERCERLCRMAREVIDKARQTRSEAVEMRLQAAQIRAERQQWLSVRRRPDGGGEPAPPSALLSASAAPADQLTTLVAFVHARLDEEAACADLFHEAGCAAAGDANSRGPARCGCRAPYRVRQKITVRRTIARLCETAIREADYAAPDWPANEMNALLDLRALAAAYEQHGQWQEEWRP